MSETDPRLEAVLASTSPILLDFDGPVTPLFIDGRSESAAMLARSAVPLAAPMPDSIQQTTDPLSVLRWAASELNPTLLAKVEEACVVGEVNAARESALTPGVVRLLETCRSRARPVAIVSNNAEAAIVEFLDRYKLRHQVRHIVSRIPARPDLMKPHPALVTKAVSVMRANPANFAFVGDSVSDVQAGQAAGVQTIGYAKTAQRGRELAVANADALVHHMATLAETISRIGEKLD